MQCGLILKGIGGFYYVLPDESEQVVACKARGRFRAEGLTPMVGDRVRFAPQVLVLSSRRLCRHIFLF